MKKLLNYLNSLEKKYSWGLLALVFAIGLALYTEVWKETSPRLEIEILSNEPVLDVRERLPDLEVTYQSEDIAKSGNTISVVLARVLNKGSERIIAQSYDPESPIEIQLKNGTLVRSDTSDASNPYLRGKARVSRILNTITLPRLIIEPGEWFIIKLLAVHKIESRPEISVFGKIAGQHEIKVVPTSIDEGDKGFLQKVFSGDPLTQSARIVSYTTITFMILALILIPMEYINNKIERIRKVKLVKNFKNLNADIITVKDEPTFDAYINYGLYFVEGLVKFNNNQKSLQRNIRKHLVMSKRMESNEDISDKLNEIEMDMLIGMHSPNRIRSVIDFVIKNNYVEQEAGAWKTVDDRFSVAEKFLNYALKS